MYDAVDNIYSSTCNLYETERNCLDVILATVVTETMMCSHLDVRHLAAQQNLHNVYQDTQGTEKCSETGISMQPSEIVGEDLAQCNFDNPDIRDSYNF